MYCKLYYSNIISKLNVGKPTLPPSPLLCPSYFENSDDVVVFVLAKWVLFLFINHYIIFL